MKHGVLLLLVGSVALAKPTIFWASDPVLPGQTALVCGDGFGEAPQVSFARLPDGQADTPAAPALPGNLQPATVQQANDRSLKFALPANATAGLWAVRVTVGADSDWTVLNRPRLYWGQGEMGGTVAPGARLRCFGLNLGRSGVSNPRLLLRSGGGDRVLPAEADDYSAALALPADLAPGGYQVYAHSGYGGRAGWSEPVTVTVAKSAAWPQTVYNVREAGALGDGNKDDTAAIQAALDKAKAAGGGIVYLPRGRYKVTNTLTIPPRTEVRGEKREWVNLAWPDLTAPPEALLRGTHAFALSDLTIYASFHKHIIVGDFGDQPEAGDIHLTRVRVRADAYRGHLETKEVDARFSQSMRWSTGGGDSIRFGGDNLSIVDCDVYGSGRSLYLSRGRGVAIIDSTFYNGRWGWYCLEGCDGMIFERSKIVGADLMATGGGFHNYSTPCCRNIWFAHNELKLLHGWDREAMTTDAGGEAYIGPIAAVDGARMTLGEAGKWGGRDWRNAGVFILDGKGAGQWRQVVKWDKATVELDRPWQVAPDRTSWVGITMFHGRYLLVGNTFTDTGAMQFYGTSVECVVANNTGCRMQGFRGLGLWYYGYQPSWYCQFLGNQITEGNYNHWGNSSEAAIDIQGARRPPYAGPLNVGSIVRGNRLDNNAHISVTGATRDVVVEGNTVANNERGVFVSRSCRHVLVGSNQFTSVAMPVVDEEALRRAAEARMKQYLGRAAPVLELTFEGLTDGRLSDQSGCHFDGQPAGVTVADGGVHGKAARFDGQSYARVDEPAVFGAPELTISLWVKPATLKGRRGFVAKRYHGTGCPFVLGHMGNALTFEASDTDGKWALNFSAPGTLQENVWQHVAAVMRNGGGVRLYVGGKLVAEKKHAVPRQNNDEPLIIGREAWGGDPPKGEQPGFFIGLMDDLRIWTRALTDQEMAAAATR